MVGHHFLFFTSFTLTHVNLDENVLKWNTYTHTTIKVSGFYITTAVEYSNESFCSWSPSWWNTPSPESFLPASTPDIATSILPRSCLKLLCRTHQTLNMIWDRSGWQDSTTGVEACGGRGEAHGSWTLLEEGWEMKLSSWKFSCANRWA